MTRAVLWDIAAILAIAILFRVPALRADFSFDEIYSFERFAREARSFGDIFLASALKHDNNHHLNTAVLYFLGDQSHWVVYRWPGALCGLVAVAAAVLIGRRRSRLDGLAVGTFVAASYLVVIYSTEARGYAWLLAFSTLGFLALDSFLTTGRRRALGLFWLSIAGGLASHPAILHFYLGALLWSGYRLRSRRRDLFWLHAAPILWIALWAGVVARGSLVGGGPPWTWNEIADKALAWTFGYPLSTVPPVLALVAAAALIVWDARRLWTEGSDEGLFFVGAVLAPVVFMTALSPPYLFPRYFLIPLFFLLIVAGRRAADLARTSKLGRWAAGGVVLLFVIGNSKHLATVSRERIGTFDAAVRLIAASAPSTPTAVTSWSLDQWTEMPLAFYATRLGLADRLRYVPRADAARNTSTIDRVDWAIESTEPCLPPPAPRRVLFGRGTYVLTRSFPLCGPSGMSWYVYQREETDRAR